MPPPALRGEKLRDRDGATGYKVRWCDSSVVLRFAVMRRVLLPIVLLITVLPVRSATGAQKCFQIRGRAVLRRGDGFFEIWHVGTDHVFFPADQKSADLICRYFDCVSGDKQPALFADFTVCPTKPYVPGAAQPVIVKKVDHPRVAPEWPPNSTH